MEKVKKINCKNGIIIFDPASAPKLSQKDMTKFKDYGIFHDNLADRNHNTISNRRNSTSFPFTKGEYNVYFSIRPKTGSGLEQTNLPDNILFGCFLLNSEKTNLNVRHNFNKMGYCEVVTDSGHIAICNNTKENLQKICNGCENDDEIFVFETIGKGVYNIYEHHDEDGKITALELKFLN